MCEPELPFRIRGAARPDEEAHADRGLLVMQDGDHLQSVRQRLDLVRREFDVARRQRTGRPLGGPLTGLRARHARAHQQAGLPTGTYAYGDGPPSHRPPLSEGITVSTSRLSGPKYFCATRCTSAVVIFWKISNSSSAVLMSLWMT